MDFSVSEEGAQARELVKKLARFHDSDLEALQPWQGDDARWDHEAWQALRASGIVGSDAMAAYFDREVAPDYLLSVARAVGQERLVVPLVEATLWSACGYDVESLPGSQPPRVVLTKTQLRERRSGHGFYVVPFSDMRTNQALVFGHSGATLWTLKGPGVPVGSGVIPTGRYDARACFDGECVYDRNIEQPQQGRAYVLASAIRAAVAVGLAEDALNVAVEYACSRRQFGRPIGSFQAVQHRLADMSISVHTAEAGVHHAMEAARSGSPAAWEHATLAMEACASVARGCAQVLGGYGFTMEYAAQFLLRYIRQLRSYESLWRNEPYGKTIQSALGIEGGVDVSKELGSHADIS